MPCCSARTAPTRRMIHAWSGKLPTTSVRRRISRFNRSLSRLSSGTRLRGSRACSSHGLQVVVEGGSDVRVSGVLAGPARQLGNRLVSLPGELNGTPLELSRVRHSRPDSSPGNHRRPASGARESVLRSESRRSRRHRGKQSDADSLKEATARRTAPCTPSC